MSPPRPGREPLRRCSACRVQRPKGELVRFVRLPDGGVALDPGQVAPGRGGYCCRSVACIERALRKGGLARTLHTQIGAERVAGLGLEGVEYVNDQVRDGDPAPAHDPQGDKVPRKG